MKDEIAVTTYLLQRIREEATEAIAGMTKKECLTQGDAEALVHLATVVQLTVEEPLRQAALRRSQSAVVPADPPGKEPHGNEAQGKDATYYLQRLQEIQLFFLASRVLPLQSKEYQNALAAARAGVKAWCRSLAQNAP